MSYDSDHYRPKSCEDAGKFVSFHKENPEVWCAFCDVTRELFDMGLRAGSAWQVMNQIRWLHYVETRGEDDDYAKLSNGHIAYYTRLWKAAYPKSAGFFSTKRMKREWEPPASMVQEAKQLWREHRSTL